MITNNADNSNNADSRRRQRQEDLGKLLLHRYNNASSQPKNNSQSVTNAENNDVSSSSSDGPKPPKNDSQSRSTATKDDDSWPSSLRTGIDNFLGRVSPALDPKQQVPTKILDDFFNKVAQWIETPKKPKDNNGRSLYSDLRTKEQYFKSLNLEHRDEENNFFQDSFFDELEILYDNFLRREAKTLDEVFPRPPKPILGIFKNVICESSFIDVLDRRHDGTINIDKGSSKEIASWWNYQPRASNYDLTRTSESSIDKKKNSCQQIPKVWSDAEYGRVLLIKGPSGSGKTMFGLEVATKSFEQPTFTFYMKPFENDTLKKDTEKRDEAVMDFVINKVLELLGKRKGDRFVYSGEQKDRHVVIMFDEIGSSLPFLRGLASVRGKLSRELHRLLFREDVPDSYGNLAGGDFPASVEYSRVHFIATGTGAHAGSAPFASEDDSLALIHLDPDSSIYTHFLESCWSHVINNNNNNNNSTNNSISNNNSNNFYEKLRRLGHKQITSSDKKENQKEDKEENKKEDKKEDKEEDKEEDKKEDKKEDKTEDKKEDTKEIVADDEQRTYSAIEGVASSIILNARCAVIFLSNVFQTSNRLMYQQQHLTGITEQAQNEIISTAITATRDKFISLNGLAGLTQDPIKLMGLAVTITALRFATLPERGQDTEKVLHNALGDGTHEHPPEWSLSVLLCIRGGVLVDGASCVNEPPGGTNAETLFETIDTLQEEGLKTFYIIGPRAKSRFDCQGAFAAMFLMSTVGALARGDKWEGLELKLADLATTTGQNSYIIDAIYYLDNFNNYSDPSSSATLNSNLSTSSTSAASDHHPLEKAHLNKLTASDSLITFKREWLIFGENNTGKRFEQILHKNHMTLPSSFKYPKVQKATQILLQDDEGSPTLAQMYNRDQTQLIEEYRRKIFNKDDSGAVLVLVNKPRQSFADVIVLGPYKVVLIQAKQRTKDSSINFCEEIRKMGVGAKNVLGHHQQTSMLEKLKRSCVRSDEEEDYAKYVQVSCCLVIEGEETIWKYHATRQAEIDSVRSKDLHPNSEVSVFGFSPSSTAPASFRQSPMYPIPTMTRTSKHPAAPPAAPPAKKAAKKKVAPKKSAASSNKRAKKAT